MMGISRLFGISMQENFCRPYFSVSLSDFWRRWHISLGEWMKDYLFYPLALSKPFGRLAQFCRRHMPLDAAKCIVPSLCTFLVFLAVGVWQGPGMANIAYGLWNGFWMSLAMFRAPIRKHLRLSPEDPKKGALVWGVVRTNLLVIIGRYFSNASSLRSALGMLKQTVLHFGVTRVHAALFTELGFSLPKLCEMEPDAGSFKWGVSTSQSYFPQDNSAFFEGFDEDLICWLRQYSEDTTETYLRGFLGRMLFSGDEVYKPAKVLSGGEKVRCMLSRMMMTHANVLLLDQPTNHLDLESIQALADGLARFPGNLLFSSHDHQFIDEIANRIIELPLGEPGCLDRTGTYEEFLEWKHNR